MEQLFSGYPCIIIVDDEPSECFPNQKPWMNSEICTLLKTRHRAFMSDDTVIYKKSRYDLGKAIKKAKRDSCCKLEDETDIRQLWRGLNAITSYKAKSGGSSNV